MYCLTREWSLKRNGRSRCQERLPSALILSLFYTLDIFSIRGRDIRRAGMLKTRRNNAIKSLINPRLLCASKPPIGSSKKKKNKTSTRRDGKNRTLGKNARIDVRFLIDCRNSLAASIPINGRLNHATKDHCPSAARRNTNRSTTRRRGRRGKINNEAIKLERQPILRTARINAFS